MNFAEMDGEALATVTSPEEHGLASKTTTVDLSQQRQQGGEEKSSDEGSVSGYSQPASVENTHSGEVHLESAPASGEGNGGDEVTDAAQAERDEPHATDQLNFGPGDDGTTEEPSTAPDAADPSVAAAVSSDTTSVPSSRVVEGSASYDSPNSPFKEEEDDSDSDLFSLTSEASDSHDDESAAVTDDKTDLTDYTAVPQTVSTSAAVATESDTVTAPREDGGVIQVEEEDTLEESPVVPSTGELNPHTGNGVVEDNPTTAADSVAAVAGSTGPTPVLSSPVSEGSVFGPNDPANSATAGSSGPINDLGQPDTTPALSSPVAESAASHDPANTPSTQGHNQEPQPSTSAAPTHVESTQLSQASRNSDVSLGMPAMQSTSLPTDAGFLGPTDYAPSAEHIRPTQCFDDAPPVEPESPGDTQPAEAAEVPRKRRDQSATQLLWRFLENLDHYTGIAGPSSTVSLAANRQPDAAAAVAETHLQAETAPGDVSPQQAATEDLTLYSSESSEDEVESNGHGSSAAPATAAAVSEGSGDFEAEADQMTKAETSPPPQKTKRGRQSRNHPGKSISKRLNRQRLRASVPSAELRSAGGDVGIERRRERRREGSRERSRGRADVRGRVKSPPAVNSSYQDKRRGKRLSKHPDKSICKNSDRQGIGEVEPTATYSGALGTGGKRKVVEEASANSTDVCKKRKLKDLGSSFPVRPGDHTLVPTAPADGSAGGHKKRKRDEEDPEGERPVKRGKGDENATSKVAHEDRTQPPAGSM